MDDHGDSTNDATLLEIAREISGNLFSEQDIDVFRVTLQAGLPYNFYSTVVNGSELYNVNLSITDADGNEIAGSDYQYVFPFGVRETGQVSFVPDVSGEYFITVSAQDPLYVGDAPEGGPNYLIQYQAIEGEREGHSDAVTPEIFEGVRTEGFIDFAGDVDRFSINLEAGQSYYISGGRFIGVKLFDSQGNEVTPDGDSLSTFSIDDNGVFFVEVSYSVAAETSGYGPATHASYFDQEYTLSVYRSENVVSGTSQDDTVTGSDFADLLNGLSGQDFLYGAYGADYLSGEAGNDTLLGGESLELAATEAQVYRVYQATLNRPPDAAGFAGWVSQIERGAKSLLEVIEGFTRSQEFKAAYGALSDRDFVELLYNNVLGRASDGAGLRGWLDVIDGGGTRAEVVHGFSESVEFIAKTEYSSAVWATHVQHGDVEGQVYRLYQATLDRIPDTAGFQGWVQAIEDGSTLLDIIPGFINSPEFRSVYGSLDDAAFVELLYNNVLGRVPDALGWQAWLDFIDGGGTRAEVVRGFSESAEFISSSTSALVDFMQTINTDWNDTLIGGIDNDILFGGRGADRFVFDAEDNGVDTVYGLEVWDSIEMNGFGYASANDFADHLIQEGADVLFLDQGVAITFTDTDIATVVSLYDGGVSSSSPLASLDNKVFETTDLQNTNVLDCMLISTDTSHFHDLTDAWTKHALLEPVDLDISIEIFTTDDHWELA